MTKAAPLKSQMVADFGERLFGHEWGAAMARLVGVNVRTITRIKSAAREGREYAGAAGVLAALYEALDAIRADVRPFRRQD